MGIMAQLQHPNLVGLHEIYKVGDDYNIVMEYIRGGELLDRIVLKEFYNEKEARNVCQSLFQAMAYCHEKRIAHRDLKPENLLLISEHDDASIKIADFGFAKICPPNGYLTMCGSPSYVAPEILTSHVTGAYDVQCDMWSLGVIAYVLLGGYSPFGDCELTLSSNIKAGAFEFHSQYWDPVSADAKNFISGLLTVDPKKRLTAKQALAHNWMTACDSELATKDLRGSLESLKRFNGKRKFRAAVNTLIVTQRITSIIENHSSHHHK
jgi:calcium/calmodulin-dependent protein kinase I